MTDPKRTTPDVTEGYAISFSPVRWHPYKPNSQQAKRGIKGRWQEMGEYGGWHNCEPPSRVYATPDLAKKLIEARQQIEAMKAKLSILADLASGFRDDALNSYHATDLTLQSESDELDQLLKAEGLLNAN